MKLNTIFSPFVRGQAGGSGLGFGLAISRQAVEAHGRRIQLRNQPGKGCIFSIELPECVVPDPPQHTRPPTR